MVDLDITVSIDGKNVSVRDLLRVDDTDLPNEFACQAARYAYIAVLAAKAEEAFLKAERARKRAEADAYLYFKNDPESIPQGSRTVSDGTAEKLVEDDDDCEKARKAEIVAKYKYHLLRDIARAFEQRANMLQSMGSHLRHEAEMQGMSTRQAEPSSRLRETIRSRSPSNQV
jgi:hypothetical protein